MNGILTLGGGLLVLSSLIYSSFSLKIAEQDLLRESEKSLVLYERNNFLRLKLDSLYDVNHELDSSINREADHLGHRPIEKEQRERIETIEKRLYESNYKRRKLSRVIDSLEEEIKQLSDSVNILAKSTK